jgi:mannan endo-1,4-beta-mannosidase
LRKIHMPRTSKSGRSLRALTVLLSGCLIIGALAWVPSSSVQASTGTLTGPELAQRKLQILNPQKPWVGVHLPRNSADLPAFASATGVTPDVMLIFSNWNHTPVFSPISMQRAHDAGTFPVFSWEPWDTQLGATQSKFSLVDIAAGRHDSIIDSWAAGIRDLGFVVVMRFAHEMNGNWYPWGVGVNSNTPADYVNAWRHVHERFSQAGAHNVLWMWSPNSTLHSANVPLGPLYPGDSYVDIVGFTAYSWRESEPFPVRMGSTLHDLNLVRGSKPLWLSETGISPTVDDRPERMTSWYESLAGYGNIIGTNYFHNNGSRDWRFTDDLATVVAFANGVATYRNTWTPESIGGPLQPTLVGGTVNTRALSAVTFQPTISAWKHNTSRTCLLNSANSPCGAHLSTPQGMWQITEAATTSVTFTPTSSASGTLVSATMVIYDGWGQSASSTLSVRVATDAESWPTPTVESAELTGNYMQTLTLRPLITGWGVSSKDACLSVGTDCLSTHTTAQGIWSIDQTSSEVRIVFTPARRVIGPVVGPTLYVQDEIGQVASSTLRVRVRAPKTPQAVAAAVLVKPRVAVTIRITTQGAGINPAQTCLMVGTACLRQHTSTKGTWTVDARGHVRFVSKRGVLGLVSGPTVRVQDEVGQFGRASLRVRVLAKNLSTSLVSRSSL